MIVVSKGSAVLQKLGDTWVLCMGRGVRVIVAAELARSEERRSVVCMVVGVVELQEEKAASWNLYWDVARTTHHLARNVVPQETLLDTRRLGLSILHGE